jgi:hypothetical protein
VEPGDLGSPGLQQRRAGVVMGFDIVAAIAFVIGVFFGVLIKEL